MTLDQRTKTEAARRTTRRILDYARRAFNERGAATVGPREIARDLGLSPGNVSYYFPAKEDLIAALIEEGHADNNALVSKPVSDLDFEQLAAVLRAIMHRDLDNKWLMRDAVGLLCALPALWPLHRRLQRGREKRADAIVVQLIDAGLLDRRRTRAALPLLRQQLLTQVFFWIPSAIVAAPERDPAERLQLHLQAALALFRAYCTPTGRRQLEAVLATLGPPGLTVTAAG